jgi:ligand-binding sensor domain-containing protein
LRIAAIFEDRKGSLCVVAGDPLSPINCFDGKRFSATGPRQPIGKGHSWGWYQAGFQDHAGDWWIPTAEGLYRYAAIPANEVTPQADGYLYNR